MNHQDFKYLPDTIDWSKYMGEHGPTTDIPKQLRLLSSTDTQTAVNASEKLSDILFCRNCDFLSEAALPAAPFIMDALKNANDTVQEEILLMLQQIASYVCGAEDADPEVWKFNLKTLLLKQSSYFETFLLDGVSEIFEIVYSIFESLITTANDKEWDFIYDIWQYNIRVKKISEARRNIHIVSKTTGLDYQASFHIAHAQETVMNIHSILEQARKDDLDANKAGEEPIGK